ncbi:MAG: hypothetical protein CMM07_19065 [Rhodopirellula sp.]|nr:hypothetical protein [Rhodopirellula sp.]
MIAIVTGLPGKGFWQVMLLQAGWISYPRCLVELIIVCFSQKTKKVVYIVVVLGAANAGCEASRSLCWS